MTDGIEQQGTNQQAAAVHLVGKKGEQWRFDAEQGAAIGDERRCGRRIDIKGLAQVGDQSGGRRARPCR